MGLCLYNTHRWTQACVWLPTLEIVFKTSPFIVNKFYTKLKLWWWLARTYNLFLLSLPILVLFILIELSPAFLEWVNENCQKTRFAIYYLQTQLSHIFGCQITIISNKKKSFHISAFLPKMHCIIIKINSYTIIQLQSYEKNKICLYGS